MPGCFEEVIGGWVEELLQRPEHLHTGQISDSSFALAMNKKVGGHAKGNNHDNSPN